MRKKSDDNSAQTGDLKAIVNFIYEAGILRKTPRSGLWFLGTGEQSVAEHLLRTAYIGYALCHLAPRANKDRVIFLCLMHDFGEGRTSDLNYIHQKYGRLSETKAIDDLAKTLPFGHEIQAAYLEEQARDTLEGKLAKDADQLEWIATLREEVVKGNTKGQVWAEIAFKRLKTLAAQKLGQLLLTTHPDDWWFDETDRWYIDRGDALKGWKPKGS